MKGYIYTMFQGADPGAGWKMTDPIFGKKPTMGACMPNIRRLVMPGDYIFAISGRSVGVKQFVVGGFQVDKKIHALEALKQIPENKQIQLEGGELQGNIIVNEKGKQHPWDYHTNFKDRLDNYIVGKNPKAFEKPPEIELARDESLDFLCKLFDYKTKDIKTVKDVIARWRKLNERQIENTLEWMDKIKKEAKK